MFILSLNKPVAHFTSVQIEAINVYAVLHNVTYETYKKVSAHEFNVEPNGLKIAEHLLQVEHEHLDIDQLFKILDTLCTDYSISRNLDKENNCKYSRKVLVTDNLISLALLESTYFLECYLDDSHFNVINRLYETIES